MRSSRRRTVFAVLAGLAVAIVPLTLIQAPASADDGAPQPTSASDDAPQPTISSDDAPQPTSASDDLPQPTIASDDLPQPTISSDDAPQPSSTSDDLPLLAPDPYVTVTSSNMHVYPTGEFRDSFTVDIDIDIHLNDPDPHFPNGCAGAQCEVDLWFLCFGPYGYMTYNFTDMHSALFHTNDFHYHFSPTPSGRTIEGCPANSTAHAYIVSVREWWGPWGHLWSSGDYLIEQGDFPIWRYSQALIDVVGAGYGEGFARQCANLDGGPVRDACVSAASDPWKQWNDLVYGMVASILDAGGTTDDLMELLRPVGVPPQPPGSDLPLIIAHGITGTSDGERAIEATARGSVPSLVPDARVVRAETTAVGSVWANAQILEAEASQLALQQGAPAVNVIAHSKGGLDARAAIFRNPELFNTLGMLSTPNGGSTEADELCALRNIPVWLSPLGSVVGNHVESQFAECVDVDDGLYDLQTSYVQDVFDKLVRDDASKRYFDLASDCSGTGHYGCNSVDAFVLRCMDGGDTAVCVESAFWMTANYRGHDLYPGYDVPGGLQVALDPVFGLQHSGMNTDPCPTLRLLSVMYPQTSTGNPWTDGGGPACTGASGGLSPSVVTASAQPSSFAAPATASSTKTEPSSTTAPVFMNRQAMVEGASSPDQPFTMTLNPEGQDSMGVVVFLEGGARPAIHVLDARGNDTGATVTWVDAEDALGVAQAQVVLTGLAGQQRTLQIVSTAPQTVGVETLVSAPMALATSVQPGSVTGTATVTAKIVGAGKQVNSRTTVTAYFTDANGTTKAVPLRWNAKSGEFTATTSLPSGPFVPIGVVASGPDLNRYAMTGIALPDGTGHIGVVHGDSLVDLDGDGSPDAVRLPVAIDVAQSGVYTLVLDVVDGNGATASASGSATLPSGSGVMTVDLPLDRLVTAGMSGPLSLVNGLLVRGDNPQKVATASAMGTTGSYDASSVVPTHPIVSRFAATAADADGDGIVDTANFSGWISTPDSGSYELTARFESPDGTAVGVDDVVALDAGMNAFSLDLPVDPATHGTGSYELTGVLLTGVDDVASWAFGHDASLQIGATTPVDDVAGLVATWTQARAVGAVLSPGLRASGDGHIRHISDADAASRPAEERAQLKALIGELNRAGDVDLLPDWRTRLLQQANALLN